MLLTSRFSYFALRTRLETNFILSLMCLDTTCNEILLSDFSGSTHAMGGNTQYLEISLSVIQSCLGLGLGPGKAEMQ